MRFPELSDALQRAVAELGFEGAIEVQLVRPPDRARGDLATNVALALAARLGRAPRQVAESLVGRLDLDELRIQEVEVAGPGFINFRLRPEALLDRLREIVRADADYGRGSWGGGRSIVVEFVSANPTGPLHVGHGRGAAMGDVVARMLEWTGHRVHREFYVNDSGAQIEKLVDSVEARYRQLQGREASIPEGGYHGEYVKDLARALHAEGARRLDGEWGEGEREAVRRRVLETMLADQEADLGSCNVRIDEFRRESDVYRSSRIREVLDLLEERGLLDHREGAVWLRTTRFGDDKDRVLVKGDGTYTYFLPDIAYHMDKAARGFEHAINVWGADHHGYVPRMQAAMEAVGLGRDFMEAIIVQLVRVERGGEEVKFSKRAGEFVTLRDLVEEAGAEVTRYFFLERSPQQQMVFDLDLALERSEKNPLYKVQYAHARIRSIYRKGEVEPESIEPDADLSGLDRPEELEIVKTLLDLPETLEGAARNREPHRLTNYLEGLANQVNSWYHAGNRDRSLRVLGVGEDLEHARLNLSRGAEIVIRNGLNILGITAPERM